MKTLSFLVLIFMVLCCAEADATDLSQTVLGRAAASLQQGQAVKVDTSNFEQLVWLADSFYYGDGAAWNSTDGEIQFVASPVGGTPRYRYVYNLVANRWSQEYMPWQGPGHGYDSNAVDGNGRHCFAKYSGPVVCRLADGTWAEIPLPPKPWAPGTEQALTYWPGHGLVLTSRDGQIAVWDGTTWTKVIGAAAWGPQHTWSVLVGDALFTGANAYSYQLTFENGQYVLTTLPAAPWNIAGNAAVHTTNGTRLLVASLAGLGWLEFDGTAWVARPDLKSGALADKFKYYVVFVPELQAIVTMSQRTITGPHEVWLIKTGANVVAPPPPPPPPPPVCASASVKICDKFDGSPLAGVIYPASSNMTKPYVKDGTLRMEIVSNAGKDTGHYRVQLPSTGEGGFLAFSYGKMMDAEAVLHDNSKDLIVWGPAWAPSCTTQQIVQTHMYRSQVEIMYTSCGAPGIKLPLAGGDFVWQNGDYYCTYHDAKFNRLTGCHNKKANMWNDYYVEIRVGHYGAADSRMVAYVREEGGPFKKYMDMPFTLPSNVPLETMMLTGYMTAEPTYTHPLGTIYFRNFIVADAPLDMARL